MTQTYNITGRGSALSGVLRGLFLAAATIGGLVLLAFSAAFAFFVVLGLVVVGALVFAFFWSKAKLLGKPFGPKAQFDAARKDFEAQMGGPFSADARGSDDQGPIIDARQTPHGWSVDD